MSFVTDRDVKPGTVLRRVALLPIIFPKLIVLRIDANRNRWDNTKRSSEKSAQMRLIIFMRALSD